VFVTIRISSVIAHPHDMAIQIKTAIKRRPTPKPAPFSIRKRVFSMASQALANERYVWGIRQIEKLRQRFQLTDSAEYMLAQLYDHEAKRCKERMLLLLSKAEEQYRGLLAKNPRYFLAEYGIGRTYWIRGDYHNAFLWQQKAYRQMAGAPKKMRGALGIGQLYEERKDFAGAQKWYRREFQVSGGDFGTTVNLMRFYQRRRNHRKCRFYAIRAGRLLKSEFKRRPYRGLKIGESKYIKRLRREIDEAQSPPVKNGPYLSSSI
jgi:tetratricopeptide (TPR) repeat protein